MQRLTLLLISLLFTVNVFAGNPKIYEDAKTWYAQEQYEKAIQGFELCKIRYKISDVDEWISKCHEGIQLREKRQLKAQADAARSAAEKAAAAAKWQKRIEDKLVYVSSDAYIFDTPYSDMHRAIKGYLSDNGFKFTDDPERAYWSVYVTAAAYEYNYSAEESAYYSTVTACVKVVDEIGGDNYENEIETPPYGHSFSYYEAAKLTYKDLNQQLGKLIANKLK